MPFIKNLLRKLLPKIFLLAGILALAVLLKYKGPIKEFFSFNLRKIAIHIDNFSYSSSSRAKRHRPVTLLQKETELQLYIGEPFRSFNKRDWEEFWGVIYGAYPMDEPEKKGLPRRVRQMDSGELAYELARRYPQPFAYLDQKQWNAFFGILFGKNG